MTSTMLTGAMTIGGEAATGTGPLVRSVDPTTARELEPGYAAADADQVAAACASAAEAFAPFAALTLERRAVFLETIARNIEALGDSLIERCMQETGLPQARLMGERGRTCGQLRLFAKVVRDGHHLDLRIDPAQPDRAPAPRPDLRLRKVPLGPVVVFGASNFPLAFSVAGGDTASALAAGCPVVVKAHGAHLGTSELVAGAVRAAVAECGLPGGVFSLLIGAGNVVGQGLVSDPRIKAVGFTGSRGGGLALVATAAARREPIPVYAEMSSINPVLLLDGALAERAERIADGFVGALTLGAGQFCTNPGLLIAVEGAPLDRFLAAATETLGRAAAATMLTSGIHAAYCKGVAALDGHADVTTVAKGNEGGTGGGQAHLFQTDAARFLEDPALQDEVFGAAALLVRCRDQAELVRVLSALEGQLTVALHLADADHDFVRQILPLIEQKAGRLVVNGFGTGVEVSPAMVHGGPFPATSDTRTTSVGTLAIDRFLRPVCYQDLPEALLPDALRDANPLGLRRMVDGGYDAPA